MEQAMSIRTISGLLAQARVLLQDKVEPYRYSDAELLENLSMAMAEARRLRPDLFISDLNDIPYYTVNDDSFVDMDIMYIPALLYYIVGMAQLRDGEVPTDERAAVLLNKFTGQLLTVTA